jgi:tRNA (guanine37-N1)-methyltransferase
VRRSKSWSDFRHPESKSTDQLEVTLTLSAAGSLDPFDFAQGWLSLGMTGYFVPMRIDIITLFPEICRAPLNESMMKRAQENGALELRIHNLRDWTNDKHHVVDDAPFGGGQGMVMKPEPMFAAVEDLRGKSRKTSNTEHRTSLRAVGSTEPEANAQESRIENRESKVILMSPAGRRFDQSLARQLLPESHLIVICGHYEGVDHRVVEHLVDFEISIGDYVLTNGAIAAVVLVDAIVRLIPGVLGDEQSASDDSFREDLLEAPQYTRPAEFRGWKVPEILLGGNHGEIAKWREQQAKKRTRENRPDLLHE